MKAVIVDIKKKHAAALDESGRIVRIHNAGFEIGQTIELHAVKPVRMPKLLRRIGSTAAAVALIAMVGTGTAYAMPYGTVTLAGSSTIEYTINCFDYVLDVQGTDEEGEALLAGMDTRQLRHHRIDTAVTATVEHMEQPCAVDTPEVEIRVVADTGNDRHTERLQQELEPLIDRELPVPPETSLGPDRLPLEGDTPQTEPEKLPDQKEEIGSNSIPQDGPAPNSGQNAETAERPGAGIVKEPDISGEDFSRPEENLEHHDETGSSKPSQEYIQEIPADGSMVQPPPVDRKKE